MGGLSRKDRPLKGVYESNGEITGFVVICRVD